MATPGLLNGHLTLSYKVYAEKAVPGFQNLPYNVQRSVEYQYNQASGANVANGANQAYTALFNIANSGTVVLNLNNGVSIQNVFGQNIVFTRIKGLVVELVSVAQNSTHGSNCSCITVGNAASGNKAFVGATNWFANTNTTLRVKNGGFFAFGLFDANGVPVVTNSTDDLLFTNEDAGNIAKVRLTLIGGEG